MSAVGGLKKAAKFVKQGALDEVLKVKPKKVELADEALDMSFGARMKRAEKMGFDIASPSYHGTQSKPFKEFKKSKLGSMTQHSGAKEGFYFSPEIDTAKNYTMEWSDELGEAVPHPDGRVEKFYTKKQNPYEFDAIDVEDNITGAQMKKIVAEAKANGHDSVIIKNAPGERAFNGPNERSTVEIVFEPSQIRSVNATFDPKKAKSGNILAGGAGLAALGLSSGDAEAGENMATKKTPKWDELPPDAEAAPVAWDAAPPTKEESESFGSKALGAVAKAAEWFDARTGAPTRKAIGVLQDDFTDLSGAASAARAQFGAPTELAPTGKQLALKAGVPTTALSDVIPSFYGTPEPNTGDPELDAKIKQFRSSMPSIELKKGGIADPTAAGVAGLGLDITLDPTNIIPVGAVAKGITGTAKGAVGGTKELVSFIKSMGKPAEKAVKLGSVEGGVSGAVINSVADTAKEIKKLVTPGVSPKWEANRAIAVKNGIDPKLIEGGALEFGPTSLITRSKQKLAQGIGGETYRAKHMQGLAKIYKATNNVVKKIGDGASPLAKIDAGEVIATEYKLASKDFFDKMDITYNTVLSQLPANAPVPQSAVKSYRESLTPVIDTLIQRSKNKFLNPQVRQQALTLASDLKKASRANGTMQDLREGMVQLKDAFENSGLAKDMPLETKVLRDMYGKTSKAYIEGTRQYLGDEVADALVANNKSMTEWFKTTERIDDLISSGKSGEEIYRKAIENADSNMLKDLKLVFQDKPGVIKRAKASFVDSLMRPDEEGIFSFARFNNKIREPKTAMVLSQLFEPQEIKDLLELTKMGENMGPQILNPSRTAEFLGLELSPKNIASEAAQRGIVDVMTQQARGRGVIPPPAAPVPKETLSKAFADNLKYGAGFNAAAQGVGEVLQDPKATAAKEVMRQTGRMIDPEEDIQVPPDYVPQLEKDLSRNTQMTNTDKAKLLLRIKKEGKISSSVLKQLHGEF